MLRRLDHQDQHGEDVEQRHAAQDHQRGHARLAVDVLDERHPQDGRAAAVGRLDELTHDGLVPHEQLRQPPDHQDARQRGPGAEQHEPGFKVPPDVHLAHVQKQHDGQRDREGQFVGGLAESLGQKAQPPQHAPRHHDQKDGQRGVQAEDQIVHIQDPLYGKTGRRIHTRPCLYPTTKRQPAQVFPRRTFCLYIARKPARQALTKPLRLAIISCCAEWHAKSLPFAWAKGHTSKRRCTEYG